MGPPITAAAKDLETDEDTSVGTKRQPAARITGWGKDQENGGHNLHEVLDCIQPRCLYFDCDAKGENVTWASDNHEEIINDLCCHIANTFKLGSEYFRRKFNEPVVLSNRDPTKYSVHIVFPQLQFKDARQQNEYLFLLERTLPANSHLRKVVDLQVYSKFQLFRTLYASKLDAGTSRLRPETALQPVSGYPFRGDDLTCFAGHVAQRHKEPLLLSPCELLQKDPHLLQLLKEEAHRRAIGKRGGNGGPSAPGCDIALEISEFIVVKKEETSSSSAVDDDLLLAPRIDFSAIRRPSTRFRVALHNIHPGRGNQFWSWFRLAGVTYHEMEQAELKWRKEKGFLTHWTVKEQMELQKERNQKYLENQAAQVAASPAEEEQDLEQSLPADLYSGGSIGGAGYAPTTLPRMPPLPEVSESAGDGRAVRFPNNFASPESREILDVFLKWSERNYTAYKFEENLEQVDNSRGKAVSGFPLLLRLLQHDNPEREFISHLKWDVKNQKHVEKQPRRRQI